MADLSTKQFIQVFFIEQLESMVKSYPYHSFISMAAGIEFLGKVLSNRNDLHEAKHSREDFEAAINSLNAFAIYRQFSGKDKYNFYSSFRCGLLHTVTPMYGITLSSKDEEAHLVESGNRLNLRCEDFYKDFKSACIEVIGRGDSGLMTNNFKEKYFSVPDDGNPRHVLTSGSTRS